MKRTGSAKWFLVKMQHSGVISMHVLMVIPFTLYFSKSFIHNADSVKGATMYSMHITPFISVSIALS